ncbi:MAG: extracellular solute-binding protein [Bacteroidota bacterium]
MGIRDRGQRSWTFGAGCCARLGPSLRHRGFRGTALPAWLLLYSLFPVTYALSQSGCARDDREALVVYSPHGKELLSAYEAAFEAAYPEVNVQWLFMGSQQVLDRVRTERVNPQASVWWGAPQPLFMRAADEGLLAAYEPTWADVLPDAARDAEWRWIGTYLTPEVIAYNTATLDSTRVPRDWDALLDPAMAQPLLIRSPLESGTMRTIFGAMIQRQPTTEAGFRWLARLDTVTRSYTADPTQLYLKLARGEAALTLWNLPDIELQARDVGYPFRSVFPESGTPVLVDAIAIPAGAPNPERAQQFVEFVTTREALIRQAHEFHRLPARQDIPPGSLPAWMRQPVRPMDLDWTLMADSGQAWLERWDRDIKGRGAAFLKANPER